MKITVNLPARPYVQAVATPLLLPDNEASIAFTSNVYAPFDYLKVFIAHNGNSYSYNVNYGEPIDLKPILKAGQLEITVHAIKGGNIVKVWEITPIIVKEVAQKYELHDVIADLTARVKALEEQHKPIL